MCIGTGDVGKWSAVGASACTDCAAAKSSTTSSPLPLPLNGDSATCTGTRIRSTDAVITERALALLSDPAAWSNEPFQHIVIEDFLTSDVLREVIIEALALPEDAATSRFLDEKSNVLIYI